MYKNLQACRCRRTHERGFNPCFNGTMYKNPKEAEEKKCQKKVSILVLMELCIKTHQEGRQIGGCTHSFNPCFNGTMYKNRTKQILAEAEA